MKNQIIRFIIFSSIISLLLICVSWILDSRQIWNFKTTPAISSILFVYVVTVIFHIYLIKVSVKIGQNFIGRFIGSSGVKMMIYLVVIVIYIFSNKSDARIFLVSFITAYVIFTILEVSSIIKYLKKNRSLGN